MKEKVICSAVIIFDEVLKEVLIEHVTGQKMKGEDGRKYAIGSFDLPKGHVEEGEEPIDAAVRECREECGLELDKSKLKYLGKYNFTLEKDLEMFFISKNDYKLEDLKCTSYFKAKNGRDIPEVNGYTKISVENDDELIYLRKSIRNVLHKIIFEDYQDLFI